MGASPPRSLLELKVLMKSTMEGIKYSMMMMMMINRIYGKQKARRLKTMILSLNNAEMV